MNTKSSGVTLAKKSTKHNPITDKPVRVRREWNKEEVIVILDYIKETILTGNDIEKPNARVYYERMLEKGQIKNCTPKHVINKMATLKASYEKAIKWRNQTGQGIEDETTVKEEILKICKHFDALDEVFGTRVTTVNPYDSETLNVGQDFDMDCDTAEYEQNDSDVILLQPLDEGKEEELNKSGKKVQTNVGGDNATDVPKESKSASIAKKRNKEPSEFAVIVNKRQAIQLEEIELSKEKLKLEKEKVKMDSETNDRNAKLEEQKFEFQKYTADAELQFRREQLMFEKEKLEKQSQLELEKFKFEQKCKLELELAKLQK